MIIDSSSINIDRRMESSSFDVISDSNRPKEGLRKRSVSKRQRENNDTVPKLVESLSFAPPPESTKWKGEYVPPPVVNQATILAIGCFLYVVAIVWPPLLLLVAYVASKLIPYSFRINDDASQRRQLFAEFSRQDDLPDKFKTIPSNIHLEESYWVNARGMSLCTTIMTPKHCKVKAVVLFCHGYTDCVSFQKQVETQRFVEQGIAFVAIEYEGHGRSDGPFGLVSDWDLLVDDVSSYFSEVACQRFPGKPLFLMGESMGGAVAFSVHKRISHLIKGVVFVCPMCKISDDMLPPQWVIDILMWLIGPSGSTTLLGYLPIAPAKQSLGDVAHKVKAKKDLYARNPLSFGRNPRLATARELIKVTQTISNSLSSFDASFLVVHGKADRVTDPRLSQALYEESKSKDKTIHLYEGMWHGLTCTEPDENIDRVFSDSTRWILERCP